MNITLITVDLAKNIFQVCGVNRACKSQFNQQMRREKFIPFLLKNYPGVTVAMEACGGSNFLGRTLEQNGFTVQLIHPNYVKPFVKGNKNDRNDAFAIAEAAMRPSMRFVRPKTREQTDLGIVHRIRERQIGARTALINQLRGLLKEYGIYVPKGVDTLRRELPFIMDDKQDELTVTAKAEFQSMYEEWVVLDALIAKHDKTMKVQAKQHPIAALAMSIRGVGMTIATAAVSHMGDPSQYKNGRQYAACLDLVPREYSSGGKQKLGGITKRGNQYLRKLLVQGAWSIIRHCENSTDRLSLWVKQLIVRSTKHKAAVALANKLARILWAVMFHKTEYKGARI